MMIKKIIKIRKKLFLFFLMLNNNLYPLIKKLKNINLILKIQIDKTNIFKINILCFIKHWKILLCFKKIFMNFPNNK